jgi:hypothetical protein
MAEDTAPAKNEFFVRRIPLAKAIEARRHWHELSSEEREALGFTAFADETACPEVLERSRRQFH